LGSQMNKFESLMQALPEKARQIADRVNSAVRTAAHDIYRWAKAMLVSAAETFLALRSLLYLLIGFAFYFGLGFELITSNTNLYFQLIGWLLCGLFVVIILGALLRLIPIPWRIFRGPEASPPSRKVPVGFFIILVGVPLLSLLLVTILTPIRFHSLVLRFVQTEIVKGIDKFKGLTAKLNEKTIQKPSPVTTLPIKAAAPKTEKPEKITLAPPTIQPKIIAYYFYGKANCDTVHTRRWVQDQSAPENKIDMTVMSIDSDDTRTLLHVAVSIHSGEEYALLNSAAGSYITDDLGKRYDLTQDDPKGYQHRGFRELKYGEIVNLDLEFPKLEKLPHSLFFSHPQFPILTVKINWIRKKKPDANLADKHLG
jgi:hypothetical protein